MAFPLQGIHQGFNQSSVNKDESAITRTNLERGCCTKSPLSPGAALRARPRALQCALSEGAAVRALVGRCCARSWGAAVRAPRALLCALFWSDPGASVVLEWLNHIIELVLCCSSNRKEKRLDYRNWDAAIVFFTAGVTALQKHSIAVVSPSKFLGSNKLVPRPAAARLS